MMSYYKYISVHRTDVSESIISIQYLRRIQVHPNNTSMTVSNWKDIGEHVIWLLMADVYYTNRALSERFMEFR